MLNLLKTTARKGLRKGLRLWLPYSRLILFADAAHWVIGREMEEVSAIARKLGIHRAPGWLAYHAECQSVFFGSHFDLLLHDRWFEGSNRLGTAYFHGPPGSGVAEFDRCYEELCRHKQRIDRIQVSHSRMQEIVLNSGIEPRKVFLIPIGISLEHFHLQTPESRRRVRQELGIPETAVVLGSFQKDGHGWGDGLEPKLIKGPDTFLQTVSRVRERVPELFVLLSGPARGYVKRGLERLGVPYVHRFFRRYAGMCRLYQALDAYVVPARDEGGPKAVLETMASGVPLIATRVGQAADLVAHGKNGWMVDTGDAAGLAYWTEKALLHRESLQTVLTNGRSTAEANSYESQLPLWAEFMQGFVE